jgi:hypothetical protein
MAEQIITGMKLRIKQEKTQIVDASRQPFDFLGYTFAPSLAARSSAAYLGARPAKSRIKRLYGKVRGKNDPLKDVVDTTNRIIVGWSQHFCYYPMGIDIADCVVLNFTMDQKGKRAYHGVFNFLGPEKTRKIGIVLNGRLLMDWSDLDHKQGRLIKWP